MTEQRRITYLKESCLRLEEKEGNLWPGLEKPISQKGANRFLLGAIMDYPVYRNRAWERSEWIAYDYLKGSTDIWGEMAKFPNEKWIRLSEENSVHRFPDESHIHRIGGVVSREYQGDARNIWKGQNSAVVRERLMNLQLGVESTNMVLRALYDVGEIEGMLDIIADSDVRRVLGRVLKGTTITKDEAIALARAVLPENPWRLESYLFWTSFCCRTNDPFCVHCDLQEICIYFKGI